jgi:hypothetical protein
MALVEPVRDRARLERGHQRLPHIRGLPENCAVRAAHRGVLGVRCSWFPWGRTADRQSSGPRPGRAATGNPASAGFFVARRARARERGREVCPGAAGRHRGEHCPAGGHGSCLKPPCPPGGRSFPPAPGGHRGAEILYSGHLRHLLSCPRRPGRPSARPGRDIQEDTAWNGRTRKRIPHPRHRAPLGLAGPRPARAVGRARSRGAFRAPQRPCAVQADRPGAAVVRAPAVADHPGLHRGFRAGGPAAHRRADPGAVLPVRGRGLALLRRRPDLGVLVPAGQRNLFGKVYFRDWPCPWPWCLPAR